LRSLLQTPPSRPFPDEACSLDQTS
jgi:hypothetical protein